VRGGSISAGVSLHRWPLFVLRAGTIVLIVLMSCSRSSAYSVVTHEEIVALLCIDQIQPFLLKHFPGLSQDQITEAHGYAYGGAVIQDVGSHPFGNREFSDLAHYVRSRDFVHELLLESQNGDEYSFALGALRSPSLLNLLLLPPAAVLPVSFLSPSRW